VNILKLIVTIIMLALMIHVTLTVMNIALANILMLTVKIIMLALRILVALILDVSILIFLILVLLPIIVMKPIVIYLKDVSSQIPLIVATMMINAIPSLANLNSDVSMIV